MEAQSFDEWWEELRGLATEADWKLGEKETYKEFYDDGDSPAEALEDDLENCEDRDE